mgnify:CR=1 FL=1
MRRTTHRAQSARKDPKVIEDWISFSMSTHHAQSARKDPKVIQDWISSIQETCKIYVITPDYMATFDMTDVQFSAESR